MCRIVLVKDAERSYDCGDRGELARAIGGAPVYEPGAGASEFECLCRLDVEKTAKANGLEFVGKPADSIVHFIVASKG
jgi:hypothetical protein